MTCHYRLVAVNEDGKTFGENKTFTVPADDRPRVITGEAKRITATTATVEGRFNPMGQRTDFWFEYGPDQQYGNTSPVTYGGLQETPRTALAKFTNLNPAMTYHYRLVAENITATVHGEDAVLQTSLP